MRLTLSPAEEKKRTKALERTEQMLIADIRIAGALMEMIEANGCLAMHKRLQRDASKPSL